MHVARLAVLAAAPALQLTPASVALRMLHLQQKLVRESPEDPDLMTVTYPLEVSELPTEQF